MVSSKAFEPWTLIALSKVVSPTVYPSEVFVPRRDSLQGPLFTVVGSVALFRDSTTHPSVHGPEWIEVYEYGMNDLRPYYPREEVPVSFPLQVPRTYRSGTDPDLSDPLS